MSPLYTLYDQKFTWPVNNFACSVVNHFGFIGIETSKLWGWLSVFNACTLFGVDIDVNWKQDEDLMTWQKYKLCMLQKNKNNSAVLIKATVSKKQSNYLQANWSNSFATHCQILHDAQVVFCLHFQPIEFSYKLATFWPK